MKRIPWLGVVPVGWAIAHLTAPAVRQWSPGSGSMRTAGRLAVRTMGDGETVVILLHGLLSSQAQFGGEYDRVGARATVVVPDLLGFAGSIDPGLHEAGVETHLDAIDAAISDLGLSDRPTVVAGHSLGSLLAIHWAARHPSRTEAVVGWSPPLYRTEGEAFEGIGRLGPFTKLLSRDTAFARRMCRWNCSHRTASGWLSAAFAPRLPVPVTRAVSQHTWAAYRGAFDRVILDPSWEQRVHSLERSGVPVLLITGDHDPLLVPGRARELAEGATTVRHEAWAGDHHLPLTHPGRASAGLLDLVADVAARDTECAHWGETSD